MILDVHKHGLATKLLSNPLFLRRIPKTSVINRFTTLLVKYLFIFTIKFFFKK